MAREEAGTAGDALASTKVGRYKGDKAYLRATVNRAKARTVMEMYKFKRILDILEEEEVQRDGLIDMIFIGG